jgi:cephalosporin hydroxylase
MRLTIDTERRELVHREGGAERVLPLYSREAFELISQLWIVVGWDQKYPYTFSWLGRPIIQLPQDLVRIQEVIHRVRPDVLVETGVAHGGSLVFYASLFQAMSKGRVIGVDVEIRPHNRRAIETHELCPRITLVEGDSVDPATVGRVGAEIGDGESVMVVLDSKHSRAHVLAELEAYHRFVTSGSYLVATDGVTRWVAGTPRGKPEWSWDNPIAAVEAFAAAHSEFVLERPAWPFNESGLSEDVTHWPSAWLRRR